MATIEIKNQSGNAAGSAELNAAVFEVEPNVHVMHEVVRSQRAARRQGTHNTLTRGKVSGGGKKPWRQKGTGRARQGTIRAPQWAGGGVVFGPHPRSYAFKVNAIDYLVKPVETDRLAQAIARVREHVALHAKAQ